MNIGKTSGGVQRLNAFAYLLALQRGADFLRNQVEQTRRIRRGQIGKINLLNDEPLIPGHASERWRSWGGRGGLRSGLRSGQALRRRRLCRRVQAQDGRKPQSCQGFPNRCL